MTAELFRLSDYYQKDKAAKEIAGILSNQNQTRIMVEGLAGSRDSFLIYSSFLQSQKPYVLIASDKEDAAYLMNDLEQLMLRNACSFFPDSFKRPLHFEEIDAFQVQQRMESLEQIGSGSAHLLVTYP